MTVKRFGRLAGTMVASGLLSASPLSAQEFSPYVHQTGKGAYDLYNDALLCAAVLEREIEAAPDNERRRQLEQGIDYARNFALFMLESGDVVDVAGATLAPDNLPVDRQKAYADWQSIFDALEREGETPDAEIDRCLRLYGHEWE